MRFIESIIEMQKIAFDARVEGKIIGLVPTMGYLHEGHLSLIKKAKKDCDVIVMCIFVNPLQFGVDEDYDIYPRDLARDIQLAEEAGVNYIFHPTVAEMYPKGYSTFVNVENLMEVLCGVQRPGHFRGVATVVLKLLNIIFPHKAYFGQKDAQQVIIIGRMVRDLNISVKIITISTKRDLDGVAISSRNIHLTKEERKQATCLYKSLKSAKQMILHGERQAEAIKNGMAGEIEKNNLAKIDYIEIVNVDTLDSVDLIKGTILIALAVKFGKTRVIDNLIMET
jgi:pantoate--beta-alanine ligase